MARVAFIGLGNMGLPMAANLVVAGHTVYGFDLAPPHLAKAAERGILVTSDAVTAATQADVIITMLPSGAATLSVYDSGILQASAPHAVFVDCSTIDVASARQAHALAAAAGRLSLDCPVSGGVGGAQAATLTLMAGGSPEALDAARPVLSAVSKRVVDCGPPGSGQAAKICNNMILGISMIAVSEAFALADKLGLSNEALFDVASTSSGQCWALTSYCPVPGPVPSSPANKDYAPGFSAALMLKDLDLAVAAAQATDAPLTLGPRAAELYRAYAAAGNGERDFSGIIQSLGSDPHKA